MPEASVCCEGAEGGCTCERDLAIPEVWGKRSEKLFNKGERNEGRGWMVFREQGQAVMIRVGYTGPTGGGEF